MTSTKDSRTIRGQDAESDTEEEIRAGDGISRHPEEQSSGGHPFVSVWGSARGGWPNWAGDRATGELVKNYARTTPGIGRSLGMGDNIRPLAAPKPWLLSGPITAK